MDIVKVQRSACGKKILIYNKDYSILYEGPYQEDLNMRPHEKKYSYYVLKGTIIDIRKTAPEQEW